MDTRIASTSIESAILGPATRNGSMAAPLSSIPYCNQQQTQLQQLYDTIACAQELMQTKSSIAGYLSAQEYPSAIQQIQYARQLLLKSLHRLTAFGSIQNQLDEYEQFVVTNLRDELVELFLE
jgi:hypothetical protein